MQPDLSTALERLTGAVVREAKAIGGQHGVGHYRAALADGRMVFVKAAGAGGAAAAAPALAAEANGLRWLAEAAAVPVPEVLGCADGLLAISWIAQEKAGRRSAEAFGRDLARMHAAGPGRLGAPWPGFIAGLPLGNADGGTWPPWYARERLLPFARLARDAGQLRAADVRLVETVADRLAELAGPAEPPSRIHGDCWSGNVLWSGGRGWLIDPAAHGGHRETDLAMLALFGAPSLNRVLAAYQEATPLADGWQARVPLHQLHPLLVHVCLFGAAYREAMLGAARAALSG
jgi:fructosamine-3-kinase